MSSPDKSRLRSLFRNNCKSIKSLFRDNLISSMVTDTATSRSSRQELLEVFAEAPDPVLTAPEVAEELDITQQAAHKKLQTAHEAGLIQRKKVGAAAVVWWRKESCPDYVSAPA